jgi:hypothetical protein
MTLLLLHPSKVSSRHPVAIEERSFEFKVHFGAVLADLPDGVDGLGVRRDYLVANLRDSRLGFHGGILGGLHIGGKA